MVLHTGSKSAMSGERDSPKPAIGGHKVKVKWAITKDCPGYTEENIRQIFFKVV